jgi:large repetitive protein
VRTNPGFGKAGSRVDVLGNALTGATAVTFNGVPATFKVVSSTEITATVPTGAPTGTIKVTTKGGTKLSSNVPFLLLP